VTCSVDHPFWVRKTSSNNPSRWCRADQLKPGLAIPYLGVWETDTSWQGGYLAGQFDGEGSLVKHGAHQRILSYYQKVSPSQEFVRRLLLEKGFRLREDYRKRREDWQEVWTGIIAGGWGEILRFLGSIRPQRLLEKAESCWEAGAINGLEKATVQHVEPAGEQWVTGLSTTTQTYWAGGLASHNSQFSFQYSVEHGLRARSKGMELVLDAPEKMFALAVSTIRVLAPRLTPGWTYRAEYLQKPRHNHLRYARVPAGHLALFDVNTGPEEYLPYDDKVEEAMRLGLECVPRLHEGELSGAAGLETVKALLERESMLGGSVIEGVVVKNYYRWGRDKKALIGKYVSESFKEAQKATWKADNPSAKDVVTQLGEELKTTARWRKAVLHLREQGLIEGTARDIGALMKEVPADVLADSAEEIKERLFAYAWPQIRRMVTAGLPDWYKQELLGQALGVESE
jgi:hypothetical protein